MNLWIWLVISLILILFVLICIVYLFRTSGKDASAAPETPEPFQMGNTRDSARSDYSASDLKKNFAKAYKWLKTNVSGKDFRYRIPWVLMIGESGSGKTTTLRHSGLRCLENIPFVREVEEEKQACNFRFFERGLVLDIAGDLVLRKNGDNSDEKMWRLLLRQFQKYRHQRPADSIVLSINCSDLIMSDTDNRDHFYARIVRKAGLLYEKLRDAQKILGMRFPVYVLITGCECIRGFEEFCKELPPDMIGNMFGWSVPYSTDTIFSPDWVSEAFRHINSIPAQTSLELFARGTHAENRDGLFMFSGNLQPLTEPIRVFLDHIFRQSAYHETYTLRGIYFCGKGAFVKDIFDRKIFPEHALARPMKDAAVSRNRMVVAVQIAAVLFTLAAGSLLWRDAVRLNADQKSMSRFIGNIDKDMTNLRAKNLDGAYGILFYKLMQEKEVFLGHSLLNLAQGMSDLKVMKYIAIPSSWFSSLHSGISKAITEAYNEIIFKDIYIRLIHKLGTVFDILNTGNSKEIAESHDMFSVEKHPEFAAMRLFADRMKEFETHAELYNNLNISTDVKALGQVIEYLYKIKLPAGFYLNEKYCKDALKKAEFRKYDVATFQIKTNIVTLKPVIGKAFTHNALFRHLKTLALQMESFGEKSRSAEHDEQLIRDLLEMISRTQAILEQQELMWIFRENPELGKPFDELMYDIENLRFFGSELRKKLDTEVGTAFQTLRNDLRDQSSSLTGPLLKREGGNITNMLSPAVLRLKSDLERLLKQKFMVLEKARETDIVIPADMRLMWNTDMLEEATRLFEPYQGYIGSDMKAFPKEMHRAVSNVARRNIEQSLLDKIAHAYQLKPIAKGSSGEQKEAELRAEIRNFKEASKYLGNLLSYSEQLDLSDSYRMLSEIAFHQAGRLLTAVSNMLDQEEFYRSKGKDFSWWDGKSRLSLSAFGVSDQKELEYYLGVQRERIRYLAYEYAEPLVAFFSAHKLLKNRKEEQLMFRWERILTELEKYETRQPDNSVAALEKLILFDLDSVKPEDYSLKININDIRQHSSDMFLRKRNEMLTKLYLRCQRIAMENAIAQYGEIRSFFEAKLSGRFPFSMILDQQVFIEAKPEDIREFYRIFDKTAPLIVNMLKAADMFGNSREDVGLFLSQMSDVRKPFAAYIEKDKKESKEEKKDAKPPADKSDASDNSATDGGKSVVAATDIPIFDINVEFRVNREHEYMANRIIEWRLNAGGHSFRNGEALHTGQWRFGEPIMFTLRWAKDAKEYPIFGGYHAVTDEREKVVSYKFDNQWSLLRFLRLHEGHIGDFDLPSDPKPHTLKFLIVTQKEGAESEEEGKFTTRAYIRVMMMTPGKTKTMLTMPYFPEIAPELKIEKDIFDLSRK